MKRRSLILLSFLVICTIIVVVQCTNQEKPDIRGSQFADAGICMACHADIAKSYLHNAHFNTSKVLSSTSILDSLHLPEGTFVFNEKTKVGVERKSDGLYQIAYVNGENKKAERADLIFGAGKSAYTLAFWYENKWMQQPLNYHVLEKEWVNSPGFPVDQIYYGRAIVTRCLECHSSFVQSKITSSGNLQIEEAFVKNSLIAGIDCQRCHGPAAAHVQYHQANPTAKEAKHMVRYQELSRSQKVDMCGVCHSGIDLQTLHSTFSFKPGDTITHLPQYATYAGEEPDVHGRQKQLLQVSKCFQLSKLDCVSCHDVHADEEPNLALYSNTCKKCHQQLDHPSLSQAALLKAENNCIDCHMPMKNSKDIGFQRSEGKGMIPYKQRTHRIAIY